MERVFEPQLRLNSVDGGPLRGGDGYQFGFYDAGILREALEVFGGNYEVYTLPIPQDPKEMTKVQEIISSDDVQYALVDKDKIVIVYLYNSPGWMSALNHLGYEVLSGDKTNKRLKSAHRPTLLNAHFEPDEIKVKIVWPEEFSRYDFSQNSTLSEYYLDDDVKERLLDGGFVISKRMVRKAVANLPKYEPQHSTDSVDYYYDPRIRKKIVHDLLEANMLNARIIFDLGFLKGNCAVVELPEGVDVITSMTNIKKEIKFNNGFRFLAEPQGPKSKVITDDQTVINFPKLFRKSDMEMWLTEEYKKLFQTATEGKLLTNWKYIYQRNWKDNEDLDQNEARARMAYVGYRWTASGFKITESPWLMETVSNSHAKPLEYRIPIPCAVYEQIVPESFIAMTGDVNFHVNPGDIRRYTELGVHVVNDLDWLEMYDSHGGHDEDDFFKLFYREFEGGPIEGRKVIAVRSPNGFGEYSIFNYVDDEWSPTWHTADGTEVKFPKVNGRGWPKRLSEACFEGAVHYAGLPSASEPKPTYEGFYSKEDVLRDINIAASGGNVGGFVNACMMHSSVIGKHRPIPLCSLEDAIDKCINPDHELDVAAIDAEAKNMFREAIDAGKPIDRVLWQKRGGTRYLNKGEQVELYDGKITQLYTLCVTHYQKYRNDIRNWSQQNARPRDIVHELGERFYTWAVPMLRKFRMDLYNTNAGEDTISSGVIQRSSWEHIYQSIVDKINSFERIEDQYDFVIALYSASIKVPTSSGKITDQIVMNRFVYPYLEAALQFYGVANIPVYRINNGNVDVEIMKNDSWWWANSDGSFTNHTTPLEFQKAHAKDSPVSFSMPKPETVHRTKSIF